MSRETVSSEEVAFLLAQTAEYVGERAATQVCNDAQVFWSDVQNAPLVQLEMATTDERIVAQGQSAITRLIDLGAAKLYARYSTGGTYLIAERNRPQAAEALRCLGSFAASMHVASPLAILRTVVSAPDAHTAAETKLTIEAIMPQDTTAQEQLAAFLDGYSATPRRAGFGHSILLSHQELGRPQHHYTLDLSLY